MNLLKIVIVSLFIIAFSFTDLSAATVEERLDQEARKEGELVWYAAMASDRAAS
jgi:hypothetical protein